MTVAWSRLEPGGMSSVWSFGKLLVLQGFAGKVAGEGLLGHENPDCGCLGFKGTYSNCPSSRVEELLRDSGSWRETLTCLCTRCQLRVVAKGLAGAQLFSPACLAPQHPEILLPVAGFS